MGAAPLQSVLPDRVTVYEVGPRDGLQNEASLVAASVKVELIERLLGCGLPVVEATSFVHRDRVPQLADAQEVMAALRPERARHPVLVPNDRGLQRAIDSGAREVALFASATESFARLNLGAASLNDSLARFARVAARASDAGIAVRAYVSMAFGDPWEGDVRPDQVASVAAELHTMGAYEIAVSDTIGVATPVAVQRVLLEVAERVSIQTLAVHFHDTYGQALANVLAALQVGVRVVDASVGGLGGCPFASGATGNLATEDLVYMLDGVGVETGIDRDSLVETAWWIAAELGREPASRVARAVGAPCARPTAMDR